MAKQLNERTVLLNDRIALCDYPGSPCARRVKITMIEKGLSWENITIDLSRMEQKHPDYLAINPNGKVPTLIHANRVIWESNEITQYLDKAFPDKLMYPTNQKAMAEVKHWQQAELDMALDYRPLMYQRLMGPLLRLTLSLDEAIARAKLSTNNPDDLEWERKIWSLEVATPEEQVILENKMYRWLDRVEQALNGKRYLVDDQFGQAEISLYPRISMYPWVGLHIDASRYANVVSWMNRLSKRNSFKATQSGRDKGIQLLSRTPLFSFLAEHLPHRETANVKIRLMLGGLEKIIDLVMNGQSAQQTPLSEKLKTLHTFGELMAQTK